MPRLQPYQLSASADVRMKNIGATTAGEWEIGYHQVVVSDARRTTYSTGTELKVHGFSPTMRDAHKSDKPPFSSEHVQASLSSKPIYVEDTPYRDVAAKHKNGTLQSVELDIKLADWIIARKKDAPVHEIPCFIENFNWGLKWKYRRRPIGNRDNEFSFTQEGRSRNTAPRPAAGKGSFTPDLSTSISNDDAPFSTTWIPFQLPDYPQLSAVLDSSGMQQNALSVSFLMLAVGCTAASPPQPDPEPSPAVYRSFAVSSPAARSREEVKAISRALRPSGISCSFESSMSTRADCVGSEQQWRQAEDAVAQLIADGIMEEAGR